MSATVKAREADSWARVAFPHHSGPSGFWSLPEGMVAKLNQEGIPMTSGKGGVSGQPFRWRGSSAGLRAGLSQASEGLQKIECR